MVLLNVYSENITIKYKSTLISKATLLVIITELFTIIFSYIIAYNTGGFWLKTEIHYEQPKINLIGDYILVAKTDKSDNPVVCSTYPFYKKHFHQYDSCSVIKLREIDKNFDGKIDEVLLEISLNLFNYTISSGNLMLPIKYQLNEKCPLKMQSLILYQYNCQEEKVTELQVIAHLSLFQSGAIICDANFLETYNTPVIANEEESKYFAIENIIGKYLEQDVTTHLTNTHTITKAENKNTFKLKLRVLYPENKIYFKSGFWQTMKTAWLQYFAIYIILSWISRQIKKYIFENKLVWYYEESPFKKRI